MVRFVWEPFLRFLSRALHSPFAFQVVVLGFFVFFVLSFRPPSFFWSQEIFGEEFFGERSVDYPISEVGFLDNFAGVRTAGLREVLVEDDAGNLFVRVQPKKRDASITYTVKSGDNPSKIAHKFGIKVSTLLWANDLNAKQSVQVGKHLRIPPTDGVFYKVRPGDTLSDIVKTYSIELPKIYAYNRLSQGSVLQSGQEIFLPDAQKIFITSSNVSQIGGVPSESGVIESIGISIRRPTQGVLTQGFHNGHYAIDIANKLNTPVYAAANGKVIKSDEGWNYGYGNHIIVDHGNQIETLYGHLNTLKVAEGQDIKVGQLIGLMGNSGRVWGPTGIHLHFELRIRGRKVNPNNYF